MRVLGFDLLFDPLLSPREIVDISNRERRIILTTSRKLLKFKDVSRGMYVRPGTTVRQIQRIIDTLDIKDRADPFTRCLRCNSLLQAVPKEKILDRIPPQTRAYCDAYVRCPSCDKTNRESFSDPRVIDRYNEHFVLAYADSESGKRLRLSSGERITEMELGIKLKVIGTPFFYFMEPSGKPILRAPGYQSAEEFLLFDRYVHGGHYKEQTFAEFKAAGA